MVQSKFQKIAIVDDCGITPTKLELLKNYSHSSILTYHDIAKSEKELIDRIGDSDCILVSWKTNIRAEVLKHAKNLKFIALCCSLYDESSSNVDISFARSRGIEVQGVKDYGDEGAVEFIFAQLIFLFKGLHKIKISAMSSELKNKSIGIIGFGTLGQMIARTALHFGMIVYYYSRSKKDENEDVKYLPLNDLLTQCDVITLHLPKNTVLLGEHEFSLLKEGTVLVNTSLGLTFDKYAFESWIKRNSKNVAIFDADGVGGEAANWIVHNNIIISDQFAGFTIEATERLSDKVLRNIATYLTFLDASAVATL
jgi:lactate dehydrogenase-like 2-hydroxyacid dehydrogenase